MQNQIKKVKPLLVNNIKILKKFLQTKTTSNPNAFRKEFLLSYPVQYDPPASHSLPHDISSLLQPILGLNNKT